MNQLWASLLAVTLLAAPALAVRVAAPVRVVPRGAVLGAAGLAGASLAAPRSLTSPALGNSLSLRGALPALNAPSLRPAAPAASLSAPQAAQALRAAGFAQAAALSKEMRGGERSKGAAAAPLMRRLFDNGRAAAPSHASAVEAQTAATAGEPLARLAQRDHRVRLEGVPAPQDRAPRPRDWKRSRWWKAVKSAAAVGGGLFLGSKAADFAYAFALAPAGIWGGAALIGAGAFAAWGLRKLSAKRGRQLFYSAALGSLLFNAGGNLIADAFGLGLWSFAAALPLAALAAAYAAGFRFRRG